MSFSTTIAIVDDNESVLRSLELTLKVLGISALTFACPESALASLADYPGRLLVLTDLRMPQLSGDVLATKLKQRRPETHIIMMSGHASQEQLCALIPEVVDAFLPKPFNPDQFMEVALPWL